MANGGARVGAGRKKGQKAAHTLEAEAIRIDLIQKAIARKGKINDALLDKAETGDVPAIREVMDRTVGKVISAVDITTKGEKIDGFNYIVPSETNNNSQS